MTPKQIELVQSTRDVLLSVQPHVANCFYDRLFALAPETRPLFGSDLVQQKAKLTNMLASLIGALGRPDIFASIIAQAGKNHARLGVLPHYYEPAGEAFLEAMRITLDNRFTPDVRDAWLSLYQTIKARMIEAGQV